MNTRISDLPSELYPFIFNNLAIKDLLNCRLVCKKFNYYTKFSNGIYKLFIFDNFWNEYLNYKYGLKSDLELLNRDKIAVTGFRALKTFVFNIHITLKYLVISDITREKFNLIELSDYINLEYLEICDGYFEENQFLKLDNLKILLLERLYYSGLKYYLETPKLRLLAILDTDDIHPNNLESIKHLKTHSYLNNLREFINLEILELYDGFIDHELFDILKNLKLLIIRIINLKFKTYYDEVKNQLIRLLDNRSNLKKRKIDIYFEGVKIDTKKQIEKIDEYENDLEFKIKNIDLFKYDLTELQQRTILNGFDYHLFLKCINDLNNEIPSSFYDKFFFIEEIDYNYKKILNSDDHLNMHNFYSFLNNLKNTIRLNILNANFDQYFYDNLPDKFHTLSIDNLNSEINYNFVFKLKKLKNFHNKRNTDLFGYALESLSRLEYLESYTFWFQCKRISIYRNGKLYKFRFEDEFKKIDYNSNLNYDQLVDFCNGIKYELIENGYIINK